MRYSTPRNFGPLVPAFVLLFAVAHAAATDEGPGLERALAAQQALVSDRGTDPVAFNDLGNLLVLAEEPGEAESAYRRAIELDPRHVSARFNLGLLLMQRNQASEAQTEFEAVLQDDPENAWAHYQLGILAEARKERADAIDHYAHAFGLDQGLSFASNNPHVIDNGLMTESLLRAQGYMRNQTTHQVPRQYGETGRIRKLFRVVETPDADERAADEENETTIDVDTEGAPSARFDAPAMLMPDDADGTVVERSRETRVLSSDDLDAKSRTGEVIGGSTDTTSRGAGSIFNRYRPPQTARPPSRRRGEVKSESASPTRRGGAAGLLQRGGTATDRQGAAERSRVERFRASTRSSAQLELVLEPAAAPAAG